MDHLAVRGRWILSCAISNSVPFVDRSAIGTPFFQLRNGSEKTSTSLLEVSDPHLLGGEGMSQYSSSLRRVARFLLLAKDEFLFFSEPAATASLPPQDLSVRKIQFTDMDRFVFTHEKAIAQYFRPKDGSFCRFISAILEIFRCATAMDLFKCAKYSLVKWLWLHILL
ncbi:hypothetical protein J6590_067343 [Homalodisca vitripennis]|nr:hypothetical protein J6590_067343 [Homalodisca vitripennis]